MRLKAFFPSLFLIVSLVLTIFLAAELRFVPKLSCAVATSPNVGVYWDNACNQVVEFINWGKLTVGSEKNVEVYIRNEGAEPFYVDVSASNWSPYHASTLLSLTSTDIGVLTSGEITESNFVLHVSDDVRNVTDFSFDITVSSMEAQEQKVFGNSVTPIPYNWSKFWKLFNAHSAWDLEYNNGSSWISDKTQLQVIIDYTQYVMDDNNTYVFIPTNKSQANTCKITLNFTAKYNADYRLTFGIDLDVKNYTYKESAWNYTLTYQNHTVFFDWSDIKDLPLDSVQHGVKPIGDDAYFWFRIRKNNVPQGYNVVIDPTFGKTDIGGQNYTGANDRIYLNKATLTEDGTVSKISFYGRSYTGSNYMQCAIYNSDGEPDGLEGVSAEVLVSTSTQWWNFTCDISLTAAVYWIGWNQKTEGSSPRYYFDTVTAASRYTSDEYDTGFPNPIGSMNSLNKDISIFATYTPSGEAYTVDLTQAVSTAWTVLTKWSATIPLTQSLTSTWQTLIEWDAITDLTQTVSTSWTVLIQTSFNVITSLSNTFTWIVEVVHTLAGVVDYIVDLTQTLTTTWTVLTSWNSIIDLSQSVTTTWTVLIQSSFNIVTSLSNTFTWLVEVVTGVSVSHIADLTLTLVTSWLVSIVYTPWTEIYATKGFVLATIMLLLLIGLPIFALVWSRKE